MIIIDLDNPQLTQKEKESLQMLLQEQNPKLKDNLEQIWYLMDKVWDEMGCNNRNLDWEKIGKYYAHPVWLLNGLFIESHDLSIQIRERITQYIKSQNFKKICDYGGGFGTLAKNIAQKCPDSEIFVYEPYPSHYGLKCTQNYPNITFIKELQKDYYDCIIATDVLEHVENPLQTFHQMLQSLRGGGADIDRQLFLSLYQMPFATQLPLSL